MAPVLPLRADDLGAGGGGQGGQLLERLLGRPAVVRAGVDRHEEGPFDGHGEVDQAGTHGRATGYATPSRRRRATLRAVGSGSSPAGSQPMPRSPRNHVRWRLA